MKANRENDSYDVAVIGLGPIGLALATLLAAKGIRVVAIDPNRLVCQHPRATHIDDETMRTLQTLGADSLETEFLRMTGYTLRKADGTPFMVHEWPFAATDQGWFSDYMFHQPDFESQLRGRLATDPNVDLWLGWEVNSIEESKDGVQLRLEERESAQAATLRAAYVVGSDGANSFVRKWMASEVEDFHASQRSLIVDIFAFEQPKSLPPTAVFILCRSPLPLTYVPIHPPMLRFELMLGSEHKAHEMEDPNYVYEMLSPYIRPGKYRIMRTDAYEWHSHLVRGWRKQRVFVAGDAAHTMTPMLGQGMCSGLRDVTNLAWKLALVIKGISSEDLLDTYELERSPHVQGQVVESAKLGNLIEAIGKGQIKELGGNPEQVERELPILGPGLTDAPKGPIGRLAPQPRSGDGRRLDDVAGYNFTIVGSPAVIEAAESRTQETWQRLGAVVVPEQGPFVEQWLSSNGADAAIIRPDRYAFALTHGPKELEAATKSLANRLFKQ